MSRKILLADDSLTIQKVVELTFAETGYEVIAMSSGDELLERLSEVQPDIVICDVIMPGRDGYEVCQEIKSSSDTLHLPVILLTGTFEPFDRDRALAAGCSEIITKPFEAKKLVETVERLATAAGAPPPPTSVDDEVFAEFEGQVTPPPPIAAPEVTFEEEGDGDLEESDVRHEFGAEEEFADDEQEEPDFFAEDTPVFVAAAVSIALEADPDDEESFELPDVEMPPNSETIAMPPQEDLDTLASDGGIELTDADAGGISFDEDLSDENIEDPFSPEADEQQPEENVDDPIAPEAVEQQPEKSVEDPFSSETDDENPFEPDTPDLDEPAGDEESNRQMTTPIDVAAVMAQGEFHEEPPTEEDDEGLTDVDESDADTQDVTERAERSVEAAANETPVEPYEPQTPVEAYVPEPPVEPFEPEAQVEPIEAEAPFEPFEAEAAVGLFEVEAPAADDGPEEWVAAEAPAADEGLEEPVVAEVPAADVGLEEPIAAKGAGLSDDDIDRIARRVLELAGDRIEHIAWDVIPDMAELVVRERVRELEAEVEH